MNIVLFFIFKKKKKKKRKGFWCCYSCIYIWCNIIVNFIKMQFYMVLDWREKYYFLCYYDVMQLFLQMIDFEKYLNNILWSNI